ncbi:histidine phosphatase family protein [Paenibacillus lutimineralis]|uniref:Histidine phosphatase family protein n=1 Tax=Paenibacillus lutimineralis TaxID=2707005 RepID=A0A3S9UX68_9BACL|nr:histidine phosphatase family protein [Paenibacillus lutimineralis]AZS14929.1 histidine phosphatase family protein [Paenibacillus lutimineralis]
MTRICFVRHGITEWNKERRAQGQSDIPLNDSGKIQAQLLAARMKEEGWDHIFSSDLSRAKETAEIVAAAIGLPVYTDQRLREMHKGETEGTTLRERIARWGEEWESLELGIEADPSISSRGTSFISDVVASYPGRNILVVSHGALITLTVKSLVPEQDTNQHLHNTSVTILENSGIGWRCELFNCALHLKGAAQQIRCSLL